MTVRRVDKVLWPTQPCKLFVAMSNDSSCRGLAVQSDNIIKAQIGYVGISEVETPTRCPNRDIMEDSDDM
jgi:hypothetical protein